MPAPPRLLEKSPDIIRAELAGFPIAAVGAALRFREDGGAASLGALVWEMLAFYRPKTHTAALGTLPPETRFREELGIDSLTLTEMVFKLDDCSACRSSDDFRHGLRAKARVQPDRRGAEIAVERAAALRLDGQPVVALGLQQFETRHRRFAEIERRAARIVAGREAAHAQVGGGPHGQRLLRPRARSLGRG